MIFFASFLPMRQFLKPNANRESRLEINIAPSFPGCIPQPLYVRQGLSSRSRSALIMSFVDRALHSARTSSESGLSSERIGATVGQDPGAYLLDRLSTGFRQIMKKQPEQRMGVNARMDESNASWRKRPEKGKGPSELLIDSD
jgi:hypothetical protein